MKGYVSSLHPLARTFDCLPIVGTAVVIIERLTPGFPNFGMQEVIRSPNVVVADGMDMLTSYISSRAIVAATSQMAYMVVGTSTTVASLNQASILGEVARRGFSATSLSINSWSAVTTFGGGTDGITAVVVAEVGIANAPGSGAGKIFNRALLGSTFTLQNSDIAAVQVVIQVGSR